MFKNYLKVAVRNLKRHKGYSLINIIGLALGIACFVLILLYTQFELSFDNFHENGDQIYRVYKKRLAEDTDYLGNPYFATTPAPLGPTLKKEYPGIINATRMNSAKNFLFIFRDKQIYESGIYADNQFLKIFTFPLSNGNKESALAEPSSIVISESLAGKLFGKDDPMGKTIRLQSGQGNLKVTGVMKNVPENSHLRFHFVISFITLKNIRRNFEDWYSSPYHTYVQLQRNHDYREIENMLPEFLDRYAPARYAQYAGYFQPLKKIHLHSHFNFDPAVTNDIKNIYMSLAIAFLLLIIACINYINLTTARASLRAKEVSVRKVIGASPKEIMMQFLCETIIIAFIALIVSFILVHLILPVFNTLADQNIKIELLENIFLVFILIGISFFVGGFSGIYPAFFLSSFQPVKVLKGEIGHLNKGSNLRNILVTIQFSVSVALIISTTVIYSQLDYIKRKDLGFKKEQIVVIPLRDSGIRKNLESFKNIITQHQNIIGASHSSYLPMEINDWIDVSLKDKNGKDVVLSTYYSGVDYDFLNVFHIKLIIGRNFSINHSTDKENAVLINETAVRCLGWTDPIGQDFPLEGQKNMRVVGVFNDFHFQSFHTSIEPLALWLKKNWAAYLSIRVEPEGISGAVRYIKSNYEKFSSDHPFDYFFLEDSFNRKYQSELKFGSIFKTFSFLAILIACLGLLAMSSFLTGRKTKEIGIRKVLGASVLQITLLFFSEFLRWVLIANFIAIPIASFFMQRWLQSFSYKTSFGLWIFLFSTGLSLFIALLTVGYQSIKAALADPVESLRYE